MKLKGLYQKTDSGIYYYQAPQKKGLRPKPVSLGTKNKNIAVERYLATSQLHAAQLKVSTLSFEVERFHAQKSKAKRHTAASTYGSTFALNQLITRLGKTKNISTITTADLANWQHALEDTVEPITIRTYLARTRSFFSWAIREGLIASNPLDGLELPKVTASRAERYCTKNEREKLIASCPADRDDLAFILHIGFFGGLRISEIIELRPEWIDLDAGTLTVQNTPTFTTKDKRHRIIRMSDRLTTFLTAYGTREPFMLRPDKAHGQKITHHKDKKTTAWKYRYDPKYPFSKLTKKAELPWVTFHTMRHTFATLHAIAGTPLTTIARELGDDERTTFNNYVGHSRHTAHANAID